MVCLALSVQIMKPDGNQLILVKLIHWISEIIGNNLKNLLIHVNHRRMRRTKWKILICAMAQLLAEYYEEGHR